MGKQGGSKLSKGGSPSKGDLSDFRKRKMERYRIRNIRYKNKIRRAEKRYKNCPKILKYVKSKIVKYRKNYKKSS